MTIAELNVLDYNGAYDLLKPCCGSSRWAQEMSARRPFANIADLHRAADLVWDALTQEDWFEAFASHPKIGETKGASDWSRKEQESVSAASDDAKVRLDKLNREYEHRFGFIFIICATGKSVDEMLSSLELRLHNDRDNEVQIAGQEQMKIVHLRLNKLVQA